MNLRHPKYKNWIHSIVFYLTLLYGEKNIKLCLVSFHILSTKKAYISHLFPVVRNDGSFETSKI